MQNNKTLIICPFAAEAKLLVSILPDCHQLDATSWQSRSTRLVTLNAAGAKPLDNYLNEAVDLHEYRCIILFGAAGALATDIEPGQVFVCNQVKYKDQQLIIESTETRTRGTDPGISGRQNSSSNRFLICGIQVTADKPVLLATDRLLLHRQTGAQLVDMESFFFAEAMKTRGFNHQIIRFISDTASQPFKLPFAANVRLGVIKSRQQILNHLS